MNEIWTTFQFFLPQILLGTIIGGLIACLGVIIVLRKMAFFGVTLSQVVSSSVAVSLFLGIQGDIFILLLSCLFLIPLIMLYKNNDSSGDTILGIVFVSFTALSQLLLNLGGNVKNHLMAAYFGDILTSQVRLNSTLILILTFSILLFIFMYKRILFLSFDENEFIVRKLSPKLTEISFYFIMTVAISISVNLLGSFYSIAHLLIPVYTGLFFARSMRFLFIFSIVFSTFSTLIGFAISLKGFQYNAEIIYLPTSSAIVVLMSLIGFGVLLYKKIR
ncbi:MAG: metal ABC transporter permease [Leptospiraceae bacterium]|nr:metal ABC transporter permease [Leptospiraceae bacterium]MBK7057428.1 metal ABC transporter permease [Leptospiraceae bacterium]MBK9503598.1 metal ABC transporter permease [Leptospiraceae bacterium]MBL0265998.1 metal ABC transporter permease [Leptospiraceae bacterium]HRG46725.1 metal ABC transporter permease [Leptospiraceae bacterium]